MKRLTQPGVDYCKEICKAECAYTVGEIDTRCVDAQIYRKLAAYEDTGLEPVEAEACKVALMGKTLAEIKEIEGLSIERMKELAKAETEGRLLILPCGVGDTVYHPLFGEGKLRCINIRSETQFLVTFDNESHGYFEEDFGKTVFLTREEAEAALRGGADG